MLTRHWAKKIRTGQGEVISLGYANDTFLHFILTLSVTACLAADAECLNTAVVFLVTWGKNLQVTLSSVSSLNLQIQSNSSSFESTVFWNLSLVITSLTLRPLQTCLVFPRFSVYHVLTTAKPICPEIQS